ncbi:MAG: GTPase ObgE, partial [Verrucomicrobiota bacterium]
MFIDEVKVFARAGHGGKGCVAFHREAYRPKGGPSGGNGGKGGDVILEASHDLNNLINQFYQPRLIAESGQAGMGKGMDGHAGNDLVIKVPCGTLVWQTPPPSAPMEIEDPAENPEPSIPAALTGRPVIRSSGDKALELGFSEEESQDSKPIVQRGELVCDLTQHG